MMIMMIAGLLHDYHDDCPGLLHDYHDDCWAIIIAVIILVTSSSISSSSSLSSPYLCRLCISSVAFETIGVAEDALSIVMMTAGDAEDAS